MLAFRDLAKVVVKGQDWVAFDAVALCFAHLAEAADFVSA